MPASLGMEWRQRRMYGWRETEDKQSAFSHQLSVQESRNRGTGESGNR